MASVTFREEQKANSPLIWLISFFIPALLLFILVYQMASGRPLGNHPLPDFVLMIIFFVLVLIAFLIITRLKLLTIIDEEKISYGFNFPTSDLNSVKLSDIKEISLVEYRFGGFGYHITKKYGIVYNMKGNKGIQIVLHSGEKLLLGTETGQELKQFLTIKT